MSLKALFPCYYEPTEAEARSAWDNAVIVVDTNILLNLYKYSVETRAAFFDELTAFKERLWMPYQVAMEFQRNRCSAITEARATRQGVLNILSELPKDVFKPFEGKLGGKANRDFDLDELSRQYQESLAPFVKSAQQSLDELPKPRGADAIRDRLEEIFSGNIGSPPATQEAVEAIEDLAERRYGERRPPGYGDTDKAGVVEICGGLVYKTKYGDYMLWHQLLSHVEGLGSPKSLIFVTEDRKKGDWWHVVGERHLGPRYPLAEEYYSRSGGGRLFMYDAQSFLEGASWYRKETVSQEVLDEVSRVSADYPRRKTMWRGDNGRIGRLVQQHFTDVYGELDFTDANLPFTANSDGEKIGFLIAVMPSPGEIFTLARRAISKFRVAFEQSNLTAGILALVAPDAERAKSIIESLEAYREYAPAHDPEISKGPIIALVFVFDGEKIQRFSMSVFIGFV